MPEPLIRLNQVSLSRSGKTILDRVSLALGEGEIATIIGPNGAGKSTLVKIALGLISPDHGSVHRRTPIRVGYVPQKFQVGWNLPLTVRRFLQFPLGSAAGSPKINPAALRRALATVGADELADAPIQSISGGETRRVLLARALLQKPELLVLDEPAAGMDIHGQTELYRLFARIRNQHGCGILLVSHDLYLVMANTDLVFCLNRHLCCSGRPEAVRQHPQFLSLFGEQAASQLAVYQHQHDHTHDLRGDIAAPPKSR